VVDDLGDNGNVTGGRTVVDENDSADFDESLESGWLLRLEVSEVRVWLFVCLAGPSSLVSSPTYPLPSLLVLAIPLVVILVLPAVTGVYSLLLVVDVIGISSFPLSVFLLRPIRPIHPFQTRQTDPSESTYSHSVDNPNSTRCKRKNVEVIRLDG
jgi:hypothetical protein